MLTLLSMALAGEDLPDVLPLSVSMMPPATNGPVSVLVVVLRNPNPVLRTLSVTPDTLRVTDGDVVLRPHWSVQTAEVRPGEQLAIFGQVSLAPGPHTLRVWLQEDRAPADDRSPDAALDVEVRGG